MWEEQNLFVAKAGLTKKKRRYGCGGKLKK